jgi:hypothetical protein
VYCVETYHRHALGHLVKKGINVPIEFHILVAKLISTESADPPVFGVIAKAYLPDQISVGRRKFTV